MTRTVFLAWQDPQKRQWHPIGRLQWNGAHFLFAYTNGALEAQRTGGFTPLAAFPDLRRAYQSERLFPLFSNRLMPESRPDYPNFLEWLNVPRASASPLVILAKSGGQRATDTLQVFPSPERTPEGEYETSFFLHGLGYMPKESMERVERLTPGERLLLLWDFQNPVDGQALAIRTAEASERDIHLLGYCPRFLCGEILKLLRENTFPEVTVERINAAPAPLQFRVLCRLRINWPAWFHPFASSEFQPIVKLAEPELQVVA